MSGVARILPDEQDRERLGRRRKYLRRASGEQDVAGHPRSTPRLLCATLQLDPIVRVPQNRDE